MKKTQLALCIGLTMVLSACQSLPKSSQNHATLNAHQLMQHTMLHRFDNSYDYEKNIDYQIDTLYDKQDIESNDFSLFFTLSQLFFNKNSKDIRNASPELLACENEFSKAYQQVLKDVTKKQQRISQQQANERLETIQKNYDDCLAKLPPEVFAEDDTSLNEKIADSEEKVNHNDDEISTNDEFITIDSIIAKEPSNYKETIGKLIETFNELYAKNQQALENDTETEEDDNDPFDQYRKLDKRNLSKIITDLRLTPEQIDVINQTYIQPQTITYKGSYNQKTGEFSTVFEENYQTNFRQSYKRMPILFNMNDMSVIFEPDMVLPFAMFLGKDLPKDLAGKSVKFVLPDHIRQNIPLPLLKDSAIKAIGQAYSDIDKEKFSELAMDDYGKSIQASRVVKIHLTPNDVGFVVGRTLKYFAKELENIRQKNPNYIKDNENFTKSLEFLNSINKLYRAEDLAKLAQLLETILPLSYNSYNYYYFNSQNQLIGYRKISDYRSGLLNAKGQSITTNVIRYRPNHNTQHTFYQPKLDNVIDGNALYQKLFGNEKLKQHAQDVRFGYDDNVSDSKMTDSEIEINNEY